MKFLRCSTWLQNDPQYKNKTTLIVTVDHEGEIKILTIGDITEVKCQSVIKFDLPF